jgi:hypothetical protein
MEERSLFHFDQQANGIHVPNRPLGEVSDFVVEQMPARLAEIRAGRGDINSLVHDIELIVAELGQTTLDQTLADEQAQELAALDMKLMEAGIVHSDGIPPENLVTIVNAFANATDQLPSVTYEDLILINPSQDKRTFTCGRAGQSEADFYEAHRIIEIYMDDVLRRLRWAIYFLSKQGEIGVNKVCCQLKKSLEQFCIVIKYVDIIGVDMNKDDFNLFRRYFQTHPIRQIKGASGAFSASIPVADLLLGGENLAEDHLSYLHHNMPYFPRNGRKEINRALMMVQAGLTLNSLYRAVGKPEELGMILQELSHTVRVFRGKHYKAVEYQLPKVITGEEVGTGRETGEFLHKRIGIRHIK